MQPQPFPMKRHVLVSNATTTNNELPVFVQTFEYRRFGEFYEACRRDRYIGLCYGPPGVGKTLSAVHYSRIELIVPLDRWNAEMADGEPLETILYTPDVITSPSRIQTEIGRARETLAGVAKRSTRADARTRLDSLRARDEAWRTVHREDRDYRPNQPVPLSPTYFQVFEEYEARLKAIPDPTTLIIVDEADRLTMNDLEQLRSIFDGSGLGMILIGMPGIEKRVARYPQFFSRIGFVHEFRSLQDVDVEVLLRQHWAPAGVNLPVAEPSPEVIAAIIRLTRGNFRLLARLLIQMKRVLAINGLDQFSLASSNSSREPGHR